LVVRTPVLYTPSARRVASLEEILGNLVERLAAALARLARADAREVRDGRYDVAQAARRAVVVLTAPADAGGRPRAVQGQREAVRAFPVACVAAVHARTNVPLGVPNVTVGPPVGMVVYVPTVIEDELQAVKVPPCE